MLKKNVKSGRHTATSKRASVRKVWRDPDDAPEITDEMLDRAVLRDGDKIIRRGRPPLGAAAKKAVSLRLDADVLVAYRKTGDGWQSRINADLRRARKLDKL
jgi:uncharacterized protein (DUF4415 family)